MTYLRIISSSTLREMHARVEADDSSPYLYDCSDSYPELPGEALFNTSISIPETPPILEVGSKPSSTENDTVNAEKVYEYLGRLTRTQAADERLWATLSHTVFWGYCKERWPNTIKRDYILEHWFEKKGAGLGALRRNAISRLWWAANLTIAPWDNDADFKVFENADRLKYTSVLLSQQQIFFDVLERSYGSNKKIRICLLDALYNHLPKVSNKDNLSKEVSKQVSLILKHKQLESLEVEDLRQYLNKLVGAIADKQSNNSEAAEKDSNAE